MASRRAFKDLVTDRRAGKTVLNVPDAALVLPPALVPGADAVVAAVSNEGKLLIFPVADVPEMPRGKGNKLYDISSKKLAQRLEFLAGITVVPKGGAPAVVGRRAVQDPGVVRAQGIPGSTRAARQRFCVGDGHGKSTGSNRGHRPPKLPWTGGRPVSGHWFGKTT